MLKYNPLHCFFAMRHTIRSLWKGTSVGRITAKLVSGTEHSRLASYIFLNTLRWVILQQLKLTYKHWSYSWIIAMHSALKFWYSSKVWLYLWFCAGKQQFPHCISILRNVINLNRPVGLSFECMNCQFLTVWWNTTHFHTSVVLIPSIVTGTATVNRHLPLADWEAGPFEAGWGEQLSCSSSGITSRCCMIVRWQSFTNKLSCPNTTLSNGTHGSHVHMWVALSHHRVVCDSILIIYPLTQALQCQIYKTKVITTLYVVSLIFQISPFTVVCGWLVGASIRWMPNIFRCKSQNGSYKVFCSQGWYQWTLFSVNVTFCLYGEILECFCEES